MKFTEQNRKNKKWSAKNIRVEFVETDLKFEIEGWKP